MPVLSDISAAEPPSPEPINSVAELTKLTNEALEHNDRRSAYAYVQQIAACPEASVRSRVLAGVLAAERGDLERSRQFFTAALTKSPDDYDARYNLALAELMAGDPGRAEQHIRLLLKDHPERPELSGDLGVVLMAQGRSWRALGCFRQALRKDPNLNQSRDAALEYFIDNRLIAPAQRFLDWNEQARGLTPASRTKIAQWRRRLTRCDRPAPPAIQDATVVNLRTRSEERRVSGQKLAFFASHQAFIKDIMAELGHDNDVRLFNTGSIDEMKQLLRWADLAWFEWCDELVIQATKWTKRCPMICRLHSYEAFTDMPSRVDWNKVDRLVFVSEAVRQLVEPQLVGRVKTQVITNGVDLNRFQIPAKKTYGKKIASVGYINYKKNTPLLLYCFKKIHEYDPGYTLHIAGEHQDPRMQLYMDNFLRQHPLPIQFEGWVADMSAWYADKDFVISTSLFESFHYSIAEGMASGLMPLVHDWFGAGQVYPYKYLFGDPDDCLRLLKLLERCDRAYEGPANREYIRKQYDQRVKLAEIEALLCDVLDSSSANGNHQ